MVLWQGKSKGAYVVSLVKVREAGFGEARLRFLEDWWGNNGFWYCERVALVCPWLAAVLLFLYDPWFVSIVGGLSKN